jgi:hypothetical protein
LFLFLYVYKLTKGKKEDLEEGEKDDKNSVEHLLQSTKKKSTARLKLGPKSSMFHITYVGMCISGKGEPSVGE